MEDFVSTEKARARRLGRRNATAEDITCLTAFEEGWREGTHQYNNSSNARAYMAITSNMFLNQMYTLNPRPHTLNDLRQKVPQMDLSMMLGIIEAPAEQSSYRWYQCSLPSAPTSSPKP